MLYLKTLGPLEVTEDGRPVRLPRAKDRALLAYLAVNSPKSFTRNFLADLLWDVPEAAKSRHSLSQSLYAIRRLAPTAICNERLIRINDTAVRTDVQDLSEAIRTSDLSIIANLIRGRFLEDLTEIDSEQFDAWRDDMQARLSQWMEPPFGSHDRWAVLQPSIQEPQPRTPFIDTAPTLRSTTEGAALPIKTGLVGRDHELTTMGDVYDEVAAGRPRFVVVFGPPGYGKSTFVDEFLERASHKSLLVRAKCYGSERRVGFGPIVRALGPHIGDKVTAALGPMWSSALSELFPDAATTSPALRLGAQTAQARLFEAISMALLRMCIEQPLILFVDDIQWSDRSTRALLAYISHRVVDGRIMIIVARRAAHGLKSLPAPWNEWIGIELKEFSHENVVQLLGVRGKVNLDPAKLLASTGGHPYLVAELINQCDDDGRRRGADVDSFVTALMRTLPPACQKVAATCATIGRPTTPAFISEVVGKRDVSGLVDRLVSSGLLAMDGKRVAVRHDIIREAIYARIPSFTRSQLHERIGDAIGHRSSRAGERAEHYTAAGDRKRAFRCALTASRYAEKRHAYDEAAYFIRLALRVSGGKKPSLRWRLIKLLERLHRFNAAYEELQLYKKTITAVPRPEVMLKHLGLGYQIDKIRFEEMKNELNHLIRATSDPNLKIEALGLAVRGAYHNGEPMTAIDYGRELRALALEMENPAHGFEPLANAARLVSTIHSASEANDWISDVQKNLDKIEDSESRLRTSHYVGHVKYELGELTKAIEIFENGMKRCDEIGAANLWPHSASHAHMVHVELGNYDRAVRIEQELHDRSRVLEATHHSAVEVACNSAMMYYETGDYDNAFLKANYGLELLGHASAKWIQLGLHTFKALCELEWGRVRAATEIAEYIRDEVGKMGRTAGDVSHMHALFARIELIRGRRDIAIHLLKEGITAFQDRDVVCRLRQELELARTLRSTDRVVARSLAKEVYETARSIGARPLAERADSLLMRI